MNTHDPAQLTVRAIILSLIGHRWNQVRYR